MQALNPLLPPYEYIPDAEPHVFDDRLYLYGSHDKENGDTFCMLDYVIWSAPLNDLGNWTNKGVSYSPKKDPYYSETMRYMYAPDCVKGNDGRYYLYYCLSGHKGNGGYSNPVSVAVCDTPDGRFEYYGYVRNKDKSPYMKHLLFDPAVINDDGTIRLYCGSDLFWLNYIHPKFVRKRVLAKLTGRNVKDITNDFMGSFHIELEDDMLTVKKEAARIDDSIKGAEYKNHRFFEGSSMRKINDTYYFIYSSINNHELCYATSKYPDKDFTYGGTIVSNGDIGYKGRKPEDRTNMTGTTHGSIECVNGEWYVFYHRLTHRSDYSRQVCAEKIEVNKDGSIKQVEMSSCGLNNGPLKTEGTYPAVICCSLSNGKMPHGSNSKKGYEIPYVGSGNDERFIANIMNDTRIVYKYFDFDKDVKLKIKTRGADGCFDVLLDDNKVSSIPIENTKDWKEYHTEITEKGVHALTLLYKGQERAQLLEISFE